MRLSVGILVVVALLGASGARIWNEENFADTPPEEGTPPYDDDETTPPALMNHEGKFKYEDLEDPNRELTELEISEQKDMEENGSEDELVDMENFDMSIFPRIDEMDPSLFIDEKDTNLTHGRCAMTFQMPRRHHCAAHHTRWFYTYSHGHRIYPAMCHSGRGNIPGFYWGGYCYYGYGHLYRTCSWSWIGVMCGHAYYSHSNYCNIFGGYQRCFSRPLFLCVASFHGWLIPGKLDQNSRSCWFLNRGTHSYYTLVAH